MRLIDADALNLDYEVDMADDWKTADLDGRLTLYLYPNEYKYVTEDSVEKDKGCHYFGIEVEKTITL